MRQLVPTFKELQSRIPIIPAWKRGKVQQPRFQAFLLPYGRAEKSIKGQTSSPGRMVSTRATSTGDLHRLVLHRDYRVNAWVLHAECTHEEAPERAGWLRRFCPPPIQKLICRVRFFAVLQRPLHPGVGNHSSFGKRRGSLLGILQPDPLVRF